jgi:hypothetical protein
VWSRAKEYKKGSLDVEDDEIQKPWALAIRHDVRLCCKKGQRCCPCPLLGHMLSLRLSEVRNRASFLAPSRRQIPSDSGNNYGMPSAFTHCVQQQHAPEISQDVIRSEIIET